MAYLHVPISCIYGFSVETLRRDLKKNHHFLNAGLSSLSLRFRNALYYRYKICMLFFCYFFMLFFFSTSICMLVEKIDIYYFILGTFHIITFFSISLTKKIYIALDNNIYSHKDNQIYFDICMISHSMWKNLAKLEEVPTLLRKTEIFLLFKDKQISPSIQTIRKLRATDYNKLFIS